MKPRIALLPGDPCGIGPELLAKLLNDGEATAKARIVVVGNEAVIASGQSVAGTDTPLTALSDPAELKDRDGVALISVPGIDAASLPAGTISETTGRWQLACLKRAAELCIEGHADGICFAPLNKEAMHKGGLTYEDEQGFIADSLEYKGPMGLLNTLGALWTSRVTSHVALKKVSDLITIDSVLDAIRLVDGTLKVAGFDTPRLAVCGFNPHAGDGGNFGTEEIDAIGPAVEAAKSEGINASGPYPPDTIFLKGRDGVFDAIVTMFHDQGQIAMKLMGFDHGVTVHAGLPYPVTTSAHGSAFDIAGKGIANVSALRHAFDVACNMAERIAGTANRS